MRRISPVSVEKWVIPAWRASLKMRKQLIVMALPEGFEPSYQP